MLNDLKMKNVLKIKNRNLITQKNYNLMRFKM